MQYFNGLLILRLVLLILMSLAYFTQSVQADQITAPQSECGEVDIRYSDDPSLTRAEKLQLMEKAFFESLSRFEMCNLSNNNNHTAAQDDTSAAQGGAAQDSVASSDMEGSESGVDSVESAAEAFADSDSQTLETPPPFQTGGSTNGAIPDDIPPANNDDAIAAQIRLAAERETDPDIQKKLWNEYRKYKGMKIEQ